MEILTNIITLPETSWKEVLVGGFIVVSVIIFIIGVLKKPLIGKIKNKLIRKAVLSFSSVALSFPTTAIYFVLHELNFSQSYLWASIAISLGTIVTYWFYENTCLRDLIAFTGQKTLKIWAKGIYNKFFSKTQISEQTKENETTKNNIILSEIEKNIIPPQDDLSNL